MSDLQNLLSKQKQRLEKSLEYLLYSFQKVQSLTSNPEEMDAESLETWEGFSARFSRTVEIFLTRYLKTRILIEDPGFRGTLRDLLNQAEKMEIIEDAQGWLKLRELRNITAHDYNDSDLEEYFSDLLNAMSKIKQINAILNK